MLRGAAGRWIRILASIELPLVICLAPALLFPSPRRVLLALAIPVAWAANRRVRGSFLPTAPINAPLALLLLMTGVSLLVTYDVRFSLGKVAGVWLGALLFWAVVRSVDTAERLRVAVAAFCMAGVVLALLGLVGTNWIGKFAAVNAVVAHLPRLIRGLPGAEEGFQPNAVAGCLVLFIPLQIGLLIEDVRRPADDRLRTRRLVQTAVPLSITLLTLMLTQSRGAIAGLVASLVIAMLWIGGMSRRVAITTLALGLAAGAIVGPARFASLAISRSGSGMADDLSSRAELWSRALYGIEDFPFTGMGMNTFRRVMPALYPLLNSSWNADLAHAHNHLLQAALDLGLPGLVAYLAIWLGTAGSLVRAYRAGATRRDRVIAGGLGAGLIAHFCFGMTDAIPLGAKVGVLFWLTLAMAAAVHQVVQLRGYPDRR